MCWRDRLATTFVVLLALIVFSACAREPGLGQKSETASLSPRQARALIQKNRESADFVVLDVRTPAEFAAGHLAGAVNVDFKAADFQVQAAKLDRGKTYLVYCRTGHRSGLALPILQRLGFARLYHLEGGITAWQRDGLPVELPLAPAP